jgi:hypothetical protein
MVVPAQSVGEPPRDRCVGAVFPEGDHEQLVAVPATHVHQIAAAEIT